MSDSAPESFKDWIRYNWVDEDDGYEIKNVQKKAYDAGQESCKKYKTVNIDGHEYILKSTADKQLAEKIEYYHGLEDANEEIVEEILKPIMEAINSVGHDGANHVICDIFRKAIKETLKLADKAGKT